MKKFSIVVFILLLIVPALLFAEDTTTLSDIAVAQEDNSAYIETMSTTINTVLEFDGKKTDFSYEYVMRQDENGNKKMMVTSHGTFTMQYLVDTADNSVTILMASGQKKKYTLTETQKQMLQQMSGVGSFGQFSDIRSMYAKKPGGVSDVKAKRDNLKVKELETADSVLKVAGRDWFNKNLVYVEFTNKDARKLKDRLDEKMNEANMAKSDTEGGKRLKKRFLEKLQKHRDKMLEYNLVKRTEKINLKNGMAEETEMFNDNGKKIGHMKINKVNKIRVKIGKKRREAIEKRMRDKAIEDNAAAVNASDSTVSQPLAAATVTVPEESVIEFPAEAETIMESAVGNSSMKITMAGTKVNEPVEFKWMEIKKRPDGGKK